MLRVTKITATKFFGQRNSTDKIADSKHDLVVVHLSNIMEDDDASGIMAGSFIADDFVITAHAKAFNAWDESVITNENTGNIDWDKTVDKLSSKVRGTKMPKLFGFNLAINEIYPECSSLKMKVGGSQVDVSLRRIVGQGNTVEEAKDNAIQREKAHLEFAISKGDVTKVLRKDLQDADVLK